MIQFMSLLENKLSPAREKKTMIQIAHQLHAANQNHQHMMTSQPGEILVMDNAQVYDAVILRACEELSTKKGSLLVEDALVIQYVCEYVAQLLC